jgi:peptidyl-prolyl cis-trans isomerase B (cyclophilin B)
MVVKQKTFLLVLVALLFTIVGCGTKTDNGQAGEKQGGESGVQTSEPIEYPTVEENPTVTITMENDKEIILELYPDIAPNTVANFISLIQEGLYDGVIFHRVIPGFMIQGGDPDGNGTGGPGYSIPGEFSANGFENNLRHERGVLSMARTNDPNSAGSQFFIMVADAPSLDGQYASFGKVIEGMEVADEIVSTETNAQDKPLTDQKIKTVVVDTKGYEYPKPEIVK